MPCWGELKSVRPQSVGEVSAYLSCVQFSGCVVSFVLLDLSPGNESQPHLQLVEKLATPLGVDYVPDQCKQFCFNAVLYVKFER